MTYSTNVPVGFAGTAPVLQLGYEMLAGGSYAACGTPVDVGTYRAVVTMTDTTGNYTFETAYGEAYTVAPAAIAVEELSTAGIWYTGNNYWLEEYLSVVTVNGQPYEAAFTVESDGVEFLTDAGEYVVEYTVTAPNHAAASGSFTLTVQKNVLVWASEYGREDWTYGSEATAELAASAKFQNGTAAAGIIAASIAGGVICSVITGYSIRESIAVTCGLGWYSLSGITVGNLAGPELGSVTFLSNLMREICAFFSIPWISRHLNYYACIGPAAATSEDTTLPMLIRYTNEETVVLSVFNGIICSAAVPALISCCYTFF